MRTCKRCKLLMSDDMFPRQRSGRKYPITTCKRCTAEQNRRWYIKNKKHVAMRTKAYAATHKDLYRKSALKSYYKHRDKRRAANKDWIRRNLGRLNEYRKRRYTEPAEMLKCRLRSRIYSALKRRGSKKANPTLDLLGCDRETLFRHIETQFYGGMSWENKGLWHIDHIRPLSSFDILDKQQLLEACNFMNLRPLWKEDNLRKGSKYEHCQRKTSHNS